VNTLLLWVASLGPLVVLLVLLVGLGWRTSTAAPLGLAVGILGAMAVFGLSLEGLAIAIG
jgi:L-lactate permease